MAVNFTVLPFGRDLLNNIEITQCTRKVWVARNLVKLADFAWDPRNDLGRHHAGGRVQDPKMQFRCDVSLRNPDVYRDNHRIVDLMITPRIGSGVYLTPTSTTGPTRPCSATTWRSGRPETELDSESSTSAAIRMTSPPKGSCQTPFTVSIQMFTTI